jgi:SAM-dependent methyltransferase
VASFDQRRRKESFDSAAAYYHQFRPRYPDEVVNALVGMTGITAGTRVLEIACGTGQLSVPLASCGVELTAVELGPNLAEIARQNLSGWPSASVQVGAFEDWPLPEEPFDVVVCATAFHWLDPDVRFVKSAQALRPGGALGIVHTHHVKGGTPGYIAASEPYYVKWGLSQDPFFEPTAPADAPEIYPEIKELPEFASVERRRLELPYDFTTESYVGMLKTDSLVLGLDEVAREGFVEDIGELIDSSYGGRISRLYVHEILVARRR